VETTQRSTISGDLPANASTRRDAAGDALDLLIDEHRQIKDLLHKLQNANEDRAAVLEQLKGILVVHCASEENVVYPAIRDLADRPMHATTLYHEQDDAQVAVWELAQLTTDDEKFTDKAAKLRDAIYAHIEQEEDHEFPSLRTDAPPEALSNLTADMRKFRATFGPNR